MIPRDQSHRDAIGSRLNETLFVEAGAGTGKTTALVGRIVELVSSGVEVHRIAAITFTEAAAAELRDRVRRELEGTARKGLVTPDAVADLDNAAITTLHGFAQRLISEHPIEAGLPPAVEVLDEIQSSIEFESRWTQFIDELFERPELAEVLLRSFATRFRLDALRTVAHAFQDQRDRLDPPASSVSASAPLTPIDAGAVVEGITAAVVWSDRCTSEDDRLLVHLERMLQVRRALEGATSELEVLHILDSSGRLAPGNAGSAKNWLDGCKAQVVEPLEAAEAARVALLQSVRTEILVRLTDEVRRFTVTAARQRMRAGRLLFHDLLVAARDLLRSSPSVRAALHERYRYLLIDEFQDTDPLQIELAVLIATLGPVPPATSSEGWDRIDLEPGRLFFVGDAKQSIYRFRRADVALFLRIRDALADEKLELNTNFRSVPGITSWVNRVFTDLIGEGTPGAQSAYDPLNAARPVTDGPGPVVLMGKEHDLPIASVREIEAAEIATVIHSAISQRWPVKADDDAVASGTRTDGMRDARFSDIAILLPTRTSLPQLEAALESARIPYRVVSSSLVWGTQEVRDLLTVLQAVDDPTDQVALVAALRSPALGCSDDDLVTFHDAGGRWNITSQAPSGLADDHPVVSGLRTLRELHDQRWWLGISAMVDRVVRELRLFELAFAHDRPRDRWRRLRFVADQSVTFEQSPGTTLRQFLTWAERQATDEARVREPSLPESDDDAVQILTVHGAKGLEFPITIVSGLNRPNDVRAASVLWNEAGHAEIKSGAFATAGYEAVRDEEKILERHERIRLLYVATTRARDHLVISVHRGNRNTDTHARALAQICDECPELWRQFDASELPTQDEPHLPPPPHEVDDVPGRPEAEWEERQRLLAAHRRRPSSSATAVAAAAAGSPAEPVAFDDSVEPGDETPAWRRGRAGTAIGRAVHAVLQTVDLATGDGVEHAARAQASAEGVHDAWREVARAARSAIDSDIVRDAVTRRYWRELYVAAPVGGTLVEGFVDLLVETPDGLVVVDYKTDQIRSDADADAAVDRYRLQLATYAAVLEESLGRPVVGAALLFISEGRSRTQWVHDLATATREVRARLDVEPT